MGTKRVGLARTQALIENLKRELDWNGSDLTDVATISTTGQIQGGAQAKLTTVRDAVGTDLANDTAAIAMGAGAHGRTFVCLLASNAKTVTLPASMTTTGVGTTVKIIQGADLVGSGVLTISAGTGNTFSVNSYAIGYDSSRKLLPTRPAAANNTITITGAATNTAWTIGSTAVFTCVASGEWYFELEAVGIGTGNAAIAFS